MLGSLMLTCKVFFVFEIVTPVRIGHSRKDNNLKCFLDLCEFQYTGVYIYIYLISVLLSASPVFVMMTNYLANICCI